MAKSATPLARVILRYVAYEFDSTKDANGAYRTRQLKQRILMSWPSCTVTVC